MKTSFFLLVFCLAASTLLAASQPTLLDIEKDNNNITTDLYLKFDMLPSYTVQQAGKRIDVLLDDTVVADSALNFTPDARIVKFLPLVKEDRTTLSFFLRYVPEKATLQPAKDNTLVLKIALGTDAFKNRMDILSGPANSATAPGKRQAGNPLAASPYAHDWRLFFSRYESNVSIKAPVHFTLFPFPLISMLPPDREKNLLLIPPDLQTLAATGQWNATEPIMTTSLKNEHDPEKKKLLALTYGEILLRAGNFSGAYKQLYLLEHSYADQPIAFFAKFLLAVLQGSFQDAYIGDYKLGELEPALEKEGPLAPYFRLLQIEMALATHQVKKMKSLLDRDDIPFPEAIARIKELRQADYWFANSDTVKAYVRYKLLNDTALIEQHPYSLNGYCDSLYQQGLFQESAQCYQKLAAFITDKAELGMVGYRKAMSELHYKQPFDMFSEFSTLEDAFPDTDAGFKAALKKNDIRFLTKKNWEIGSARAYRLIADHAISRATVEEAAFKEALVYKLMGKNEKSAELLMEFLRDFRTGNLIETAQAALLDILPGELRRLVQKKEYVKALVLAKQNKMFFEKNWLDSNLLADMAVAYQELHLFEEAKNLYLYLIEIGGPQAEAAYLPGYIATLYRQGRYDAVDEAAARYLKKYPQGGEAQDILLLRLQALFAGEKIEKAISLLPTPLPDILQLQELAAALYFQKNDFAKAADILLPLQEAKKQISPRSRFILAESLYQQGRLDTAEELFATVLETDPVQDQALFRLASIKAKKGEKEKAVKLFAQLAEKGKDPLWRNLAQKELQLEALSSN